MNNITFLFSDYTFQIVAIGATLLGAISGALGCFAVLSKQSLLGDGISHASLSGVVLAFLLIGVKDSKILLLGALFTGILASLLIFLITKHSKISFDSALAMVLAVFFGFAMILLTIAQKIPNANQAGLDRFIYGQACALLLEDVILIFICGVFLLLFIIMFWKEFKLLIFDEQFAKTLGYNTYALHLILMFLIVVSIIIGLQTVGAVLMSAMLVAPAISARLFVNSLWKMVLLSSFFGAFSGFLGTLISSLYPNTPTGPSIVICMSIIAFFSFILPKGGAF